MNWLDFVILIILAGFVFAAYSAGLIREVVTLVSVIVGILAAGILYDDLSEQVLGFMDKSDLADAISFLVLFGSVYLFGQIVAYTLKTGASLLMLGPADHFGGAFFGLLKGLLVVQVLLIVLAAYPELGLDGAVERSFLGPVFVDDISIVLEVLPKNFDRRIDAFLAG